MLKNTHFTKLLKGPTKYTLSLVQKASFASFCYSFSPAEGKSSHWFWLTGNNFSFTSSEFTIHCKDPQIKWKQTEPSGKTLSINNILFTLMKALPEWEGPDFLLLLDTSGLEAGGRIATHVLSEHFLQQIQSYWLQKQFFLSFSQAINFFDNFASISRNPQLVKNEWCGKLISLTPAICIVVSQAIQSSGSSSRHTKVLNGASLCNWSKHREPETLEYNTPFT